MKSIQENKSLGQVAFETWNPHSDWKNTSIQYQQDWESAAQAVVRHFLESAGNITGNDLEKAARFSTLRLQVKDLNEMLLSRLTQPVVQEGSGKWDEAMGDVAEQKGWKRSECEYMGASRNFYPCFGDEDFDPYVLYRRPLPTPAQEERKEEEFADWWSKQSATFHQQYRAVRVGLFYAYHSRDQEVDALREEVEQWQKHAKNSDELLQIRERQNREMEQGLAEMQKEDASLTTELEHLKENHRRLTESHARQGDELEQTKESNRELETQLEDEKTDCTEAHRQIQSLQKQLEEDKKSVEYLRPYQVGCCELAAQLKCLPIQAVRFALDELTRLRKLSTWVPCSETQQNKIAAAIAHRGCCGSEDDPANGKLHGYCIVCGVEWPCETAKQFLFAAQKEDQS